MSSKRHLLSIAQQRQAFGEIAHTHGLDPLVASSWYSIRASDATKHKGIKDILHVYKNSFVKALLRIFPHIGLDKNKLIEVNATTIPTHEKRRLINELSQQLGYGSSYEDFYQLSSQKFRHNGLRYLILPYNDSAVKLITSSFPEHAWHEWLFEHPPIQLWNDKQTHKHYVDWLGTKLGIKDMGEWYARSAKDVHQNKGKVLLSSHYNDSLGELLKFVYPDHNWNLWLFQDGVSADFWKCSENCTRYLEWLGDKLGFSKQEDWYKITNKNFEDNHGGQVLEQYSGSAAEVVIKTFSSHAWDTDLMLSRLVDFAKQKDVLGILEKVAAKVNLQRLEEWHVVTRSDLFSVPLGNRLYKFYSGNMLKILQTAYPDYQWDASKFLRNAKNKRQFLLELFVRELFKGYNVLTNARKNTQMKFSYGNQPYMELDIYLPEISLALEYQDPHHYFSVWYASKPLETYQQRDAMKAQAAVVRGITLIHVPFWWDGTRESLIGTIRKQRSDLLQEFSNACYPMIPPDPPGDYEPTMLKDYYVPGIGVPMLACPLLSLDDFHGKNWWMIEKFDGIRAFWSPTDNHLISRSGRKLQIPSAILEASFLAINFWMDGEIWFGYGKFDEAGKVAHKALQIDWPNFKYIAFDAPNYKGTYKERYTFLQQSLSSLKLPHITVPLYQECTSTKDMMELTQAIINKGGEGIILRDPGSLYCNGRSQEFLKLKKFRDAEARVVAITGDVFTCELPNGIVFSAPAEPGAKKKYCIQENSIISFKHRGFTNNGMPKLPIVYCVRLDVLWKDLKRSEQPIKFSTLKEYAPHLQKITSRKPLGFWSDLKNVRNWFNNAAKNKGLDPLGNEWHNITLAELRSIKGSESIRRKYGTLLKALHTVYPNVSLQL
eukprot:Phypoly_transcript_00762.p1 GENE.Phypoly_transcript_00762~~Phypoly_transcript_00762.p1  ORF type:complete len:886 (-),score=68.50 Phypoly_transcript_00762:72-2729(-)